MLSSVSAAARSPGTGARSSKSTLSNSASCARSRVVPSTDRAASATRCRVRSHPSSCSGLAPARLFPVAFRFAGAPCGPARPNTPSMLSFHGRCALSASFVRSHHPLMLGAKAWCGGGSPGEMRSKPSSGGGEVSRKRGRECERDWERVPGGERERCRVGVRECEFELECEGGRLCAREGGVSGPMVDAADDDGMMAPVAGIDPRWCWAGGGVCGLEWATALLGVEAARSRAEEEKDRAR